MKRAGDVIGVPLWQCDPMAAWEDLNMLSQEQERKKDAADSLNVAKIRLDECISWCDQASGDVDGLPVADRIMSIINSLEELQSEMEKLQKNLSEGGE